MQESQLPQWFINDWNDFKAKVSLLEAKFDSHLNNHHGGATRRQQVQDWVTKAGGGGGVIVILLEVLKKLV